MFTNLNRVILKNKVKIKDAQNYYVHSVYAHCKALWDGYQHHNIMPQPDSLKAYRATHSEM